MITKEMIDELSARIEEDTHPVIRIDINQERWKTFFPWYARLYFKLWIAHTVK